MHITTSTYVDSIAVTFSTVINQFSLWKKLVGIPSDGGTNLERCMVILESNFDNTGVLHLGKHTFCDGVPCPYPV